MGLWPFGRRKSTRRSKNATFSAGDVGGDQDGSHNGRGYNGDLGSGVPERRQSRRDKKRRSSRDSKKLRKDSNRTYSFSPGRGDNLQLPPDQDRPPVPPIPIDYNLKGKRAQTDLIDYEKERARLIRASTQPQQEKQWERMPTLHKKSVAEVARRKSSKRKKEERDREAEIRAMTEFMPNRPAAPEGSSGRLLKRESGKLRRAADSPHRKSDDISLPEADSIHSSLTGSEQPASYKLSAFDMLAPRPTIKYADYPRYAPPTNITGVERSGSKKRRISERISVPEGKLKPNKRINELADDLDASELRELMERDQKRRDKKQMADRIKAEKRIARRQERQRQEELRAARDGTPPPANLERGVMGREVVGLGIGTSAVVTATEQRRSTSSERQQRASNPVQRTSQESSVHGAFEVATPDSDRSDPIIETAKVGRISRASMSPPASPKGHAREASNISEMIDLAQIEALKATIEQENRRPSEPTSVPSAVMESDSRRSSAAQPRSSWTSFFRRRSKQPQSGPAEPSFSNTSRDSMLSSQQGPIIGYTPMRSTSNVPKRTMSKFREDLPELPISPPDSRVQSPEAVPVPPINTSIAESKTRNRSSTDDSRVRYDTPTSGFRSIEALRNRNETPTSARTDAPSPEDAIISHSLASIDSEGSWLSGKRAKRGSGQAPHMSRDSAHALQKRFHQYSDSSEELGIAEDEYFSRLSPEPESSRQRRISGNPVPSSDEEDGGMASPTPSEQARTKWGAVARTPTVIHRGARIKSREGLLNDFQNDSLDDVTPAPSIERRRSYGFDKEYDGEGIQRARSVDLVRGHVRQISAGSARLLDLKPRDSTDAKRRSQV